MNTNTNTLLIAIVAFLIGGIGGYALHAQTSTHGNGGMMSHHSNMDGMMTGTQPGPNGGMMGNNGGMGMNSMNGMGQMMEMMVENEREFLTGMIPHHQEAVDTAKEVIARGGTTPQITQLVENIVVAQEAEIAKMKQWYQDWYNEAYADDGEYMTMMRDLSQLSGAELDRTFLEDMIMHHMGAIMMARSVEPYIEHSEIQTFAQNVIQDQASEIQTMRTLLKNL